MQKRKWKSANSLGGALIYVPIWKGEFWSDSTVKHLIRNQKLARNLTSQSLSLLRF